MDEYRQLDAQVAEAMGCDVMWRTHKISSGVEQVPICGCLTGFSPFSPHSANDDPQIRGLLEDYSTDIAAAWPVWEALPAELNGRPCKWDMVKKDNRTVEIWLWLVGDPIQQLISEGPAPEAICRAFLRAMGRRGTDDT